MNDALFSVERKKVFITGAGSGIGLELTKAFATRNAQVACLIHNTDAKLSNFLSQPNISILHGDLRREEFVREIGKQALQELGGLDILIHCAWACPASPPYSLENLDETLTVGLRAPFILYKDAAEIMSRSGGGSIISIGSINGSLAFPENPAYTAAKAALRLFTKVVARDFGTFGVRANNLCPGYVITRMTEKSYANPELQKQRSNRTMLRRWATPEDMIGAAIFLASDASKYITGTDLYVDGGWMANGL